MKDAVITEMHRIKDAIAAENKHDVRAIMASAKRKFRVPAKRLWQPAKQKKSSA